MEKITFTPTMRERIIHLQKENNYTDRQTAGFLHITEYKYKNIKSGKNKRIEAILIKKLAYIYECTEDYILGYSNSPSFDKRGREITYPINFDEAEQKLKEVSNYLHGDYITLNSLHLILCRTPEFIQKNILSSINSICANICTATLMEQKNELTRKKFEFIINNLKSDNPEYTKMAVKLAEADAHLSKKRYQKALNLYIEIIYHASEGSKEVVPLAISNVKILHDNWSNFPEHLAPLIDYFSQITAPFFELPPKAEAIICKYFKSQKMQIQERSKYIKALQKY